MSDKLREALERAAWWITKAGHAEHCNESPYCHEPEAEVIGCNCGRGAMLDLLRAALAADDAVRGTMPELPESRRQCFDAEYSGLQMRTYGEACWQAATRAAAPIPVPNSRQLSEVIAEYEAMPERAAALADARASLKAAAPQGAEPVWIQPDHLQKARRAPFLCRVEPAHRDDFVPLYTSPPAAPTDAEWEAEHLRLVRSYGKVCWAAGAGGDAIACLAIADALGALRAHLSTRAAAPQNVKPVAWLAYDGAHQLFIVGGNGPHDVYGGFPVYLHPAPTEADRLDAERWQPIETAPRDGSHILLTNGEVVAQGHWLYAAPYIQERRDLNGRYIDQDEFDGYEGWVDFIGGMLPGPTYWMPLPERPAIDAAMSAQAGGKEQGS